MSVSRRASLIAVGSMVAFALTVPILVHPPAVSLPHYPAGRRASGEFLTSEAFERSKERALNAYTKLPLTFVENAGQMDSRVRFYGEGPGYAVYFTPHALVFSYVKHPQESVSAKAPALWAMSVPGEKRRPEGLTLALQFLGANPEPVIEGTQPAPGVVNYFIGNNPARWHAGLITYETIVYHELWPGVDLAVRGRAGELKYEFLVQPGARVENIRLTYGGSDRLSLDDQGTLVIDTPLGRLRDSRPASYQLIEGRHVAVESHYVLKNDFAASGYGFAVVGYDSAYTLVIDPGLVYSTFLGGGLRDEGAALVVDAAGNAYVAGRTYSSDFPTTLGAFDRVLGAASDIFIVKVNAAGSALVYSTFLGGEERGDRELPSALAVDAAGNAYITGSTEIPDFPTTPGAFDRTFGSSDMKAFITKLNPAGTGLVYSTFLGGEAVEQGHGIAVDAAGNVYVTGAAFSSDFPTTPGAFDRTLGSMEGKAFITKLNPAGTRLVYSTFLGGGDDQGYGIVVDAAGNAYVTGTTSSSDFPTTPGAFDRTFGGVGSAFITKLNPAGSGLVYSTYLGGEGGVTQGNNIAVDATDHAYVTGLTESPDFPTSPGAFDRTPNGGSEAYITKFNPAGSGLVYSTVLGGANFDKGFGIAVDAAGNVHVTGITFSPDFPTTLDALDHTLGGFEDAFVTKLNPFGTALVYSTFLGGGGIEHQAVFAQSGAGLALDAGGNAYVAGWTTSFDFPTTPDAFDRTFEGGSDAFITKLALGVEVLCEGRPANLVGTNAGDVLIGTDGDDVIAGMGGNDGIRGRGGNDIICAGPGDDVIEGGGGLDVLFGQVGNDLLDGGPGSDQLIGDKGDDTLLGQSGPDELYGGTGDDTMDGGTESDFCVGASHLTGDTAVNCEAVQGVP